MRLVRGRLLPILELFALAGVAIAVPVLDVFGRSPETFVRAGATRSDLWIFAAAIALGPPTVAALIELLVGFAHGTSARRFHAFFVIALVAVTAIPLIRDSLGLRGAALLILTLAIAVVVLLGGLRFAWLRSWTRFAAPLPAIAMIMFLFASPVADIANAQVKAPVELTERLAFDGPIIMLVLDEFPLSVLLDGDGLIDRDRFPNFARLADGSAWYRNTTAVAGRTEQAVPALLTGRYPTTGIRPPDWSQHPDNLFRLLAGSYAMFVDEETTRLCPPQHCPDLALDDPRGVTTTTRDQHDEEAVLEPAKPATQRRQSEARDSLFDLARQVASDRVALDPVERLPEAEVGEALEHTTATSSASRTVAELEPAETPAATTTVARPFVMPSADGFRNLASSQPTRFLRFLDDLDASSQRRRLHYLHLLLPHVPWRVTASGIPYQFSDARDVQFPGYDGAWSSQVAADAARVRLSMQAGYVDALLGALIERLEQLELWNDALVVVAADHGMSLLEGSPGRAIRRESHELLGVPLFVRAPGLEPRVDDRPSESIDLLPTIADVLGAKLPWTIDGISLFRMPRDAGSHPVAVGEIGTSPKLLDVDVRDHLDLLLATAKTHHVAPTSSASRDRAFLELGPRGDLLGTDGSDDQFETVAATVEFPARDAFRTVDLGGVLPLHVVGHLNGGAPGTTIVIVVNGRVAGVAETFSDQLHASRFTAILDPSALHAGMNEIEVLQLSD